MAILARQHQLLFSHRSARLGDKRTLRQEVGSSVCCHRAERRKGEDGEVGTLGRSALDWQGILQDYRQLEALAKDGCNGV